MIRPLSDMIIPVAIVSSAARISTIDGVKGEISLVKACFTFEPFTLSGLGSVFWAQVVIVKRIKVMDRVSFMKSNFSQSFS